ncbi:hypothetical protein VIGAN_11025500 [Vigna angularis var. angularis]|uniref:Uncharacterized protein n=1 Tax=Vigna angularis var. angularis TaxID=157739 RepID=A0A0S3T774_PHAAN|nr:hypothetical protein VIGAN_11025500 [Vigna angularis var. angularis]
MKWSSRLHGLGPMEKSFWKKEFSKHMFWSQKKMGGPMTAGKHQPPEVGFYFIWQMENSTRSGLAFIFAPFLKALRVGDKRGKWLCTWGVKSLLQNP